MNLYKLKELGSFKNGANYPKDSYGSGLPIVSVKDLFTPRYVDLTRLAELKNGAIRNEDDYLIKDNDILFSRSSLVQSGAGMWAIAHKINKKTLFCGFIIRYRIHRQDVVNPLYLLYLLRTPAYRKLFTGTQQTNIANINQDTLGDIEVDLPDLKTQNHIVAVLKSIDDKRDSNIYICSVLEAMAKLLYDYWFVQFDFPDENGKPYKSSGGKMVWNEELKREIPEGWMVKTLGEICSFMNGINYDKNENGDKKYHIVNVRNITASSLLLDSGDLDDIILQSSQANKYIINNEDILIARSGTPGSTRLLYNNDDNTIFCGFIIRCAPNNKDHRYYITYCLKQLEGTSATITGGSILQNVSQDTLSRVTVVIPTKDILIRFNQRIKTAFDTMQNMINENQQLASLRDFLLPMLMNGQVAFKDN